MDTELRDEIDNLRHQAQRSDRYFKDMENECVDNEVSFLRTSSSFPNRTTDQS